MGRTLAVRSGRGLLSALGRPQGEYWYSRSRPRGCWPSARQSSRALRMVLTPAAGRPGGAGRRGRLGDRPIHGSRHGIARSSASKVRGCSLTNSGSLGHRNHGPSDFRSRDRTGDVGLAGGDVDRQLDRAAAVRLLLYAVKQQSRARGCSGDEAEAGHRRGTPVSLGHRRPPPGVDPDASFGDSAGQRPGECEGEPSERFLGDRSSRMRSMLAASACPGSSPSGASEEQTSARALASAASISRLAWLLCSRSR
jgi:hypothetical protein